jgi:hypothetical protein
MNRFKTLLLVCLLALTLGAQTIPQGFLPIASSATNILDPTAQAEFVTWARSTVVALNSSAISTFQGQCGQWTAVNIRNRQLNLSLTPKPTQPTEMVFSVIPDPDGSGTLWVGQQPGGLMGAPCPDLPALITNQAAPNTPDIGVNDWSNVWVCQSDDTVPAQALVVVDANGNWTAVGNSGHGFKSGATPPAGTYQKVPAPVGNGWYFKVQ